MQKYAEECWTQLVYVWVEKSYALTTKSTIPEKELFGIEFKNILKCLENGQESSELELVFTLKCHILQEINHLHEGLKHGLKGELKKTSPVLGRSTVYMKQMLIFHNFVLDTFLI